MYSKDPTVDYHSIYDPVAEVCIRFDLKGIFSYFNTRALTKDKVDNWENYRVIICHHTLQIGI